MNPMFTILNANLPCFEERNPMQYETELVKSHIFKVGGEKLQQSPKFTHQRQTKCHSTYIQ